MSREAAFGFDPALPIEEAWTPPAAWYEDEAFLHRELATVFAANWLCVARSDQVETPGAYAAFELGPRQGVVVRGADGALRAFHNVCRHHAARLLEGTGTCAEIACPYHGWTYALDGRLTRAPRCGGIAGFRREDFGLLPLAVAEWGPLVFVHFGSTPPPVADGLGSLLADLDTGGLRWVAHREYRLRCNWKVFADNYLDGGYHVPVLHAALAAGLDLDSYRTDVFARHAVQSCRGKGDDRVGTAALYAYVHPNLMLNRYGAVLDANVVVPLSARECLVAFDWWIDAARAGDAAFVAACLAASDRVQIEDVAISESVQRGLASGAFARGRYAPRVEIAMHWFHRLLARDIAG